MSEKIKQQILIVDDTEINRTILKEFFNNDFTILEASDGMEALSILENNSESIFLILLDIKMPIMDGYVTLTEMKKSGYLKTIPVIAMSSNADYDRDLNIIDMGAEDIIRKPFIANLVKKRVNNVIIAWQYKKNIADKP